MRLNLDSPLLEQMTEGVILISRQAQVQGYNRAAAPWLTQARAMLGVFKTLIEQEVRGRVTLPLRLGVWHAKVHDQARPGLAWLIMDGRRDYALFIVPESASAPALATQQASPATEQGYLRLLGADACAHLQTLRKLLEQPGCNAAELATQASRVAQLLQEISDLSLLLQQDEVFVDQRLVLADIVQANLPTHAKTQPNELPQFVFQQHGAQQGTVYGHAPWLGYALRVLFEQLQTSAPPDSRMTISTHQLGNFVVLTGHVVGDSARLVRKSSPTPTLAPTLPPSVVGDPLHQAIRLLMCRRILELHAGQLKLEYFPLAEPTSDAEAPIESFTLTLATGLPLHERSRASCATCPANLQMMSYATDMAQLLHPT
jgi:hypothetical protein